MRKTFSIVALLLVIALLLAACGSCEHEWTQADCLSAAVCIKCNEAGAAAMGHDWTPATCTAPEMCTRCAEMRGEKLEHAFGEWIFMETEMVRICEGCGAEECGEIDREQYLQQMLPGHWDFTGYYINGNHCTIDDLRYMAVGFYATMNADGTCRIYNGSVLYENVNWEFSGYEQNDTDKNVYFVTLSFPYGSQAAMALRDKDGEQTLYFFYDDSNYAIMKQNKPVASALAGAWTGFANGMLYTLELNEDRTMTGDLNGPVTGTWHLEPMEENNGYRSCTLNIQYTRDGWPDGFESSLNLGSTQESLEEYLENLTFSMWQMQLGSVRFERSDPDAAQQMQTALEEGSQKLIGTWTSEILNIYFSENGENQKLETEEYSLTFLEDGTAVAVFDKEYTGTWKFDKVELSENYVAYYDYPNYYYQVQLQGVDRPMTVQILSYGRVNVSVSDKTRSMLGWFNQTSDGESDYETLAPDLIIGQWDAVEQVQNTDSGTVVQIPDPGTYTLTVNADGTFTADFGGPVTGNWCYSEHNFNSGYCYSFSADGLEYGMTYTIHTPGQLRAFYEIDGIHYGFTMEKE